MAEQEFREYERLVPSTPGEFKVAIMVEGAMLSGEMVDFSSFGLGALLPYSTAMENLFRKGGEFSMQCTFGKSTFPSKGNAVNVREIEKDGQKFLRVGFALVAEGTPYREHLAKRRRELRLEVDEHLSPIAVCEDEFWLGERVFMRVRDISANGFALELPSARVPLLPKQRVWLRVIVPFFGEFKAFVKIAYIKKINGMGAHSASDSNSANHTSDSNSDNYANDNITNISRSETVSYLIGVVMLRTVADVTRVLSEYLFYTHPEFNKEELQDAGFALGFFSPAGSYYRVRLVRTEQDVNPSSEKVAFTVENMHGLSVISGLLKLDLSYLKLTLETLVFAREGLNLKPMQSHFLGVSIARFLLIYSNVHFCEKFEASPEALATLKCLVPNCPQVASLPGEFFEALPAVMWPELSPLFLQGQASASGWKGRTMRALAFVYQASVMLRAAKREARS